MTRSGLRDVSVWGWRVLSHTRDFPWPHSDIPTLWWCFSHPFWKFQPHFQQEMAPEQLLWLRWWWNGPTCSAGMVRLCCTHQVLPVVTKLLFQDFSWGWVKLWHRLCLLMFIPFVLTFCSILLQGFHFLEGWRGMFQSPRCCLATSLDSGTAPAVLSVSLYLFNVSWVWFPALLEQ